MLCEYCHENVDASHKCVVREAMRVVALAEPNEVSTERDPDSLRRAIRQMHARFGK